MPMDPRDMSPDLWPAPSQSDWPLYGLVDDVRPAIEAMFEAGDSGALVTLIGADGPSPRPIGSQMLITSQGLAAGYVSGGCVEASLELMAQEVLTTKQVRRVQFGGDSPFLDVELVCGTSIDLVIEPIAAGDPIWTAVLEAAKARRPVSRILLNSGQSMLAEVQSDTTAATLGDRDLAYRRDYKPNPRLVIFGSDPVALATANLAHTAGLEVLLIRYLGPDVPPDFSIGGYQTASSFDILDGGHLDAWTALVTTTHDLETDHQILRKALASDAFYVGALGSMRKRQERIARLEHDGLTLEQVAKLHAPVGLDIGAATPYEIAISILADVIAHRRNADPAS
jgi:xanthine dehydrogenase accessory factor